MADAFDLNGRNVAITGAGGVICSGIAHDLATRGMGVAVLDLKLDFARIVADSINRAGGRAIAVEANVLQRDSVQSALDKCRRELGEIQMLINGAGGNHPDATTGPDRSFFDLPIEAFDKTLGLNVLGTVIPCQVFGKPMAERRSGVILNVASMNALRPLTKIPAYSAAKSAVRNFTEWLAVHMCQEYSPDIRVNAVAPGFLLTHQNRFLLTDEKTGEMTPRGRSIIDHTPMKRYGEPKDLYGTVAWLLSDASRFVTGITVPVDGGFSAFSGV